MQHKGQLGSKVEVVHVQDKVLREKKKCKEKAEIGFTREKKKDKVSRNQLRTEDKEYARCVTLDPLQPAHTNSVSQGFIQSFTPRNGPCSLPCNWNILSGKLDHFFMGQVPYITLDVAAPKPPNGSSLATLTMWLEHKEINFFQPLLTSKLHLDYSLLTWILLTWILLI